MNSSYECIIQFKWHWLSGALCFPLLLAECVKSLLFLFILTWSLFCSMAWTCWRHHHSAICFLDRGFLADVLRGSTQVTNLLQKLEYQVTINFSTKFLRSPLQECLDVKEDYLYNGSRSICLQSGLMPHELIHCTAQIRRSVTWRQLMIRNN